MKHYTLILATLLTIHYLLIASISDSKANDVTCLRDGSIYDPALEKQYGKETFEFTPDSMDSRTTSFPWLDFIITGSALVFILIRFFIFINRNSNKNIK